MKNTIEGIYAALISPMTESGELNFDALRKVIRWQLGRGVEGFYVCGSSADLQTDVWC